MNYTKHTKLKTKWSPGEMADSRASKGIHKTTLEHLGVSESEEALKKKSTMTGICQRNSQPKELPMTRAGTI